MRPKPSKNVLKHVMKPVEPNHNILRTLLCSLICLVSISASAKCGAVDYSWGVDGLQEATSYLGTMVIYTIEVLYAGAAIMVIVASLQIYIKMNLHEGDVTKSIMMLIGGILFMIGAMIVMPAFFGYQDMSFIF